MTEAFSFQLQQTLVIMILLEFDPTSGARFIQNSPHSPRRVPGPIQPFSAKQWPKTPSFCFPK